jgi:hypothetical protein
LKLSLVYLAVALSGFYASGTAKGHIKTQTEAGFNLTEKAALSILDRYKFTSRHRTDYYADIYDGHQFWLIPNPARYKFRMQAYKDKWIFQANTKESVVSKTCPQGWAFKVSEKAVGELSVKESVGRDFSSHVRHQLNHLLTRDVDQVVEEILKLDHFILGLNVPLLPELINAPKARRWIFTASHLTKKKKWTADLEMGLGAVETSITEARDLIGDTFIQNKYELEFQIGLGSMAAGDFAESICRFMKRQKLALEDTEPEREKVQEETLARLKRFNYALDLDGRDPAQ